MAAIAVHGFINVDLVGKTAAFAGADEEAELEGVQVFSGGSAANVAVGLARLGQEAFFLGAIGDDGYASLLKKELEDVNCDYLQTIPGIVSGTVMVIVDRVGLRTLYTYLARICTMIGVWYLRTSLTVLTICTQAARQHPVLNI